MVEIKQAVLKYNLEEKLPQRYGFKLRGFFANRFSDILFHNHKENGNLRFGYPLIQYKIINGKPMIVGVEKGAELIIEHFLDIDKLILGNKEYIEPEGRLEVDDLTLDFALDLDMLKYNYKFLTPWMGLNQKNYRKYKNEVEGATEPEKRNFFSRILIGNILAFAKGIDWWLEEEVNVVPDLESITVKFKNKKMMGFIGGFYSNIKLPNYVGVGQSTARGFGTIKREALI